MNRHVIANSSSVHSVAVCSGLPLFDDTDVSECTAVVEGVYY